MAEDQTQNQAPAVQNPQTVAQPTQIPSSEGDKIAQLRDAIVGGKVPQLVLIMISYALELRSSDIHIEPDENMVRVRYRIDGALRTIIEYPTNMHPAVVSRIKIMSNLKIDEQRVPQDGRSTVTTKDNREMDLRVSTLPTVNGEKIVMRIQDKSRKIPTFAELGIDGNNLEFVQKVLDMPNGIILLSGPTGSGKTTTLYSALTILNQEDVNILTIEDPVEIQLSGLNQSQVHPDIKYTFASGLRAALRQDPDIIMVGEIRDKETMDVAVESALTGHLVLSTIHTNSSVETLTRIDNMGIQGYLIAATLNAVIAQRLVRKICDKCKMQDNAPDPKLLESIKYALSHLPESEKKRYDQKFLENPVLYKGKGCEKCGNTGFYGRVGIYEVFSMDNTLRRMVTENKSTMDIEKAAKEHGMITLEQCGALKALKGDTAIEEIYNVAREEEKPAQTLTPKPNA